MPCARHLALEALSKILSRGRKPKEALEPLYEGLDPRDRSFLTEVVYGVVRHLLTVDWLLGRLLRKTRPPRARTLNNLRAGIYQIFFMRVPDWASVNEAVELEGSSKGLVNAVLRNAQRRREELGAELKAMRERITADAPAQKAADDISLTCSHPLWLVKRWIKRFGVEEAHALSEANNIIPTLTLRVNTLRAGRPEVLELLSGMGIPAGPTVHSPVGITISGPCAFSSLEPLRGLVSAQDEAAQLISIALGPMPGDRVLDACAAPGGKTTHMAQMMNDQGEIVAMDIDGRRLEMLARNVTDLGLSCIRTICGDVTEAAGLGGFDKIMLDAPCSATGTVRRNPDVKYRLKRGDLSVFGRKQLRLLGSVSSLLKPGGTLYYCTCSTEPEEGEQVAGRFLKTSGDYYIINEIPSFGPFMEGGYVRTYPHRHGMDGFFGALIGKNA